VTSISPLSDAEPEGGQPRPRGAAAAFAVHLGIALLFVVVALALRGQSLMAWSPLNPDEAELMAQGRAAMLSPVPFTTWTMGTTGPFWVLFLALLGVLGVPLTVAFAHFLAAVLMALMGFVVLVLLRRSFGAAAGAVLSLLWWLPVVLIFPVGGTSDFGAMSTELLPVLLVLCAALFPIHWLSRRPWLFLVVGVLCGLAVGAKYQVLPLAAGLVVVQLISLRWRPGRWLLAIVLVGVGFLAPFVPVVAAVLLSPDVSLDLVKQNFNFLGSYAGGMSLEERVRNTAGSLLHQPYLLAMLVILVRVAFISSRRVLVSRLILVSMGLAAVFAGGKGFDHYLIILFVAVALAIALPTRPGSELLPWRQARRAVIPILAIAVVAVIIVGGMLGRFSFASPVTIVRAVSPASVIVDPALAAACPPGSRALVWGWAPEFYLNYSWQNTVPFMNTLGLSSNADSYDAGRAIVSSALERSDCVIDAVGPPFFGVDAASSITAVYPEAARQLSADYRVVGGLIDCDACTVYVRK
jgi:hypothetical protein